MSADLFDFEDNFFQLTKKRPYPWQRKLFEDLLGKKENWPSVITAPTGAGKTSLMPIWLIALAQQAASGEQPVLPRRLVWVVNRRVVVDQATDEAKKLLDGMQSCVELDSALRKLGGLNDKQASLAISTLRGEKADNREWSKNPARASIVIGTVDMVGSRLLFRGYGDGDSRRVQHAALLGQDCLIVNDEAHLSVAFKKVLTQVPTFHRAKLKPWHSIFLSATLPDDDKDVRYPASFETDCAESTEFLKRYRANKKLDLISVPDAKSVKNKILELALADGAKRTIIFFKRPKEVSDFVVELEKKNVSGTQIAVITGTQRGFERDELTKPNGVLSWFQGIDEPDEPKYLVATSAGEVGIDASCSRLITTLDSVDHLVQRFGRLNRFGESTDATAHVLYVPVKDEKKEEWAATALRFLSSLDNVNADTLFELGNKIPFPPGVACASIPDWAMERWAMTSITGPAGVLPRVEPYLHGKQEDLPRTALAWRRDAELLAGEDVDPQQRQEALRSYRLLAKEKLEAPTRDVRDYLVALAGIAGTLNGRKRVIHLDRDGKASLTSLDALCDEKNEARLRYCTVILPEALCILKNGMLDAKGDPHSDVADPVVAAPDGESSAEPIEIRARFLLRWSGEEWKIKRFGTDTTIHHPEYSYLDWFKSEGWKIVADVEVFDAAANVETEEIEEHLVYVKRAGPKTRSLEVKLDEHLERVGVRAGEFAERLGLSVHFQIFMEAGRRHDLGKDAPIWRKAMRVPTGQSFAKTAWLGNPKQLGGYRHELGSLTQSKDLSELGQHVIATHHGRSRPHFEPKARDPENDLATELASRKCPTRFAKLQKEFGFYELAYLESVLRAADWICSAEEQPDNE